MRTHTSRTHHDPIVLGAVHLVRWRIVGLRSVVVHSSGNDVIIVFVDDETQRLGFFQQGFQQCDIVFDFRQGLQYLVEC